MESPSSSLDSPIPESYSQKYPVIYQSDPNITQTSIVFNSNPLRDLENQVYTFEEFYIFLKDLPIEKLKLSLTYCLQHESEEIRCKALDLVEKLSKTRTDILLVLIQLLVELLSDDSENVRIQATKLYLDLCFQTFLPKITQPFPDNWCKKLVPDKYVAFFASQQKSKGETTLLVNNIRKISLNIDNPILQRHNVGKDSHVATQPLLKDIEPLIHTLSDSNLSSRMSSYDFFQKYPIDNLIVFIPIISELVVQFARYPQDFSFITKTLNCIGYHSSQCCILLYYLFKMDIPNSLKEIPSLFVTFCSLFRGTISVDVHAFELLKELGISPRFFNPQVLT